jgi:hypothetical protein
METDGVGSVLRNSHRERKPGIPNGKGQALSDHSCVSLYLTSEHVATERRL